MLAAVIFPGDKTFLFQWVQDFTCILFQVPLDWNFSNFHLSPGSHFVCAMELILTRLFQLNNFTTEFWIFYFRSNRLTAFHDSFNSFLDVLERMRKNISSEANSNPRSGVK